MIPLDYRKLTGISYNVDEEHENSVIATSQSSSTDQSEQVSAHMAENEEDLARLIEEQQSTIRQ